MSLLTLNSYTVSFCKDQKAYHVSTLAEELKTNLVQHLNNSGDTYKLLGVFNTAQECDEFILHLKRLNGNDR